MLHFIKKTALLVILVFILLLTATAQPSMPSGFGEENDQETPIGSGIVILLALAGAYGVKKVYDANGSQPPTEPPA